MTNRKRLILIFSVLILLVGLGAANAILRTYQLIFRESGGANTVTLQPPTLSADYTLTLPVDDGTANQLLKTDGSGVLSWTSSGGSSGGTVAVFIDWSGTLSISHNTATKLTFSGATVTTLSGFTNSSGTLTTTTAGVYSFRCQYENDWSSDSATMRHIQVMIYVNGSEVARSSILGGLANNAIENRDEAVMVEKLITLATNDTVECYVYQSNTNGTAYNAVKAYMNAIYYP